MRGIKFFVIFLIIFGWIFSGWPQIWQNPPIPPEIQKARAANYLTNPSFTGGTTGWTLTTFAYDSAYYQDSAGSVKLATAVGRNKTATGNVAQTISTNINSTDTVLLSHYWSKQCVAVNCAEQDIRVEIAKPSAPTTWVAIWSDTSSPAFGSATAWAGPSGLDVSSFFDETGEYLIRLYADIKGGNNASGQALAWFDNAGLDVTTAAVVSVSVSDGVVTYGTMAAGASKSTLPGELNDIQTATNDGNVTENFNIKGQNTACPWTLAATSGNDQYVHQFCNDTANDCTSPPTNYTALITTYQTLATGVTQSGAVDIQLRITVPDPSSCFTSQSVDVTIQATQ